MKQPKALPQSGNFAYTLPFDKALDPSLFFLRTRDSTSYALRKASALTLKLKPENEQAGLVIFQNEQHFYYLCKSLVANKPVVQLFKSGAEKQPLELLAQLPLSAATGKVQLRISAEGDAYHLEFAETPQQWRTLKDQVDARFLSTQVAGGFIGCLFGMYATSSGQPTTNAAAFKYLKYEGHDAVYQK